MKLRVFIDMVMSDARTMLARQLKRFVVYTYGDTSDVCVVSAKGDKITYATGSIEGVEDIDAKSSRVIRHRCGQNILVTYGLPGPDKQPPVLMLMPTPALVKALGVRDFIKFMKDWPGYSMAGQVDVVKYVIWKD